MSTNYTGQDRGDKKNYQQYLEAMDAISVEKVASASVFFESRKGNTIVDVGMASGTSTAILARLFPEMKIIGVDINPKMVQIAQDTYNYPNLSFREDDGEKLQTFSEDSVSGFFNCSAIHHITSYNGYDTNRALNTLRRQVELLKDKGVLIIRDFVKPEEQEIIIELSSIDKPNRPDDAELFIQFAQTARSLVSANERGFPIQEINAIKKNTRRFQAFYTDAVEFIRRKDYYANWDIELQEEYGYFTQEEFEEIFRELGLRIILSSPIYNQWIINNRYRNQFGIYNLSGKKIGFPPTNYLIAGEKTSGGKQVQLIRHLPVQKDSFLHFSFYQNLKTKKVYDVVERPNNVLDIIPFYKHENGFTILAKHGYPRPLANVKTDSAILDDKHYSGYIPEGITIAETENIEDILNKRFGISKDHYTNISQSLNYYTSPGGINEKVASKLIELIKPATVNKTLSEGFSGFKESGYIHEYEAAQLLNTAQTGALVEARLELNVYNLFFKKEIPLPQWLGEKMKIRFDRFIEPTPFSELLSLHTQDYEKSEKQAGFLTTRRAYFSEMGIENSNAIFEYVYPSAVSSNTLVTLPVLKKGGQIYVGLEVRNLPVPQIHSGNSTIITAPAKRLPKEVCTIHDLEEYISDMRIGRRKIERYSKLGEKYFPSVGISTEQVYPYLVCLDEADKSLRWVSLKELYNNIDKIEDAHLLICLCRLIHTTNFLPQQDVRDLSFENFVEFINDNFIFSDKVSITKDTLVEKDLGITGDDGEEFLLAIHDEFGIDFRDETGSIRKAFNLKENEYLFQGEGLRLFDWKNDRIVPFTVAQFYDVIVKVSNDT
ncbi:ubiquinone/menaquinone biosynthesis C-methylase UbiE [Dysgonomonas sp. PFB1-18]|uniref:methyltransferase domain-containing protein n=1 Tax=unclassified Dysgonomonas TaxID=2630389 RepID=UPI002472ECD3|nr:MULTISPECIES: methyltransferase domain-containing protein [unclassified Dysgonomonas]MDH6308927.1 ubiquinone/menaquinone biosynthesis C-methylase UbiE [Dysgonomonas sp. PF1-14]MDH6338678.1 ubiquinone/menaquinone biosynthesis C-methylase UbiE [Dysgonomonas sp. PF1-16]MDH6380294.1 ubiquinone/menaquinone biosynthesis C-methylase UbiE [Dysgonomonas sp. PFB1-18]MDH6397624.1 ubiquinone/menaquinone biosynthesis C-methylase UbiE [Dysgonomonas sp. PF1-23]